MECSSLFTPDIYHARPDHLSAARRNCCLLHVFSFSSGVSSVFDQGATVHMKCSRVLQALGLHLKTAMYVPLGIFSSSRYE